MMKPLLLLALALLIPAAFGYLPAEPRPMAAASPEGLYLVRLVPATQEERPMVSVYQRTTDGVRYEKVREFPLAGGDGAVAVFVTDTGDVYTFCDWVGDRKHAVAFRYPAEGGRPKRYSMRDLLPASQLEELARIPRSRAPLRWRREGPYWVGGKNALVGVLVVPDVLGGAIAFNGETVEYESPEKRKP